MNDLINFESNKNGFDWTSLQIAEWAGKEHKNVLADIRNEIDNLLEDDMESFVKLNFQLSDYMQDSGRKYPKFNLTRLGV